MDERGTEGEGAEGSRKTPPGHPVMVVSFSWMGKTSEEQVWDVWESESSSWDALKCLEPGWREVWAARTEVGGASRAEPFTSVETDELTWKVGPGTKSWDCIHRNPNI